jgi:hypothetical protein
MLGHIKADNLKRLFFQFCTSQICTIVQCKNLLFGTDLKRRPIKSSSPWLPCRSLCPCPRVRSPDRKLLPLGRSRVPGLFVCSRISRIMGISSSQEDFGGIFERFLGILLQRNQAKYPKKEKRKFVSTLVDPREGKNVKHS